MRWCAKPIPRWMPRYWRDRLEKAERSRGVKDSYDLARFLNVTDVAALTRTVGYVPPVDSWIVTVPGFFLFRGESVRLPATPDNLRLWLKRIATVDQEQTGGDMIRAAMRAPKTPPKGKKS